MTANEKDVIVDLTKEVHELKIAVRGNGTKGLGDRMDNAEDAFVDHLKDHPNKPPDRATILKTRVAEMGFAGAVIAFIIKLPDIISFFSNLAKGGG